MKKQKKKLSLITAKILKTAFFSKENISKLERNKDSIKHVLLYLITTL